ncbi:MAG: hypothetical protein A2Y63_06700 [Candidatus Riflebacteria bacterium RBG_13_59_9]|nr:MAG: hypothetical protein A2Y63_06700 [Candidatus Riflebacteria bacterium RBG_13_59_9]
MTAFEPRVVTAWFASFFVLFFGLLLLRCFIPALATVVIFGAIFAAAYHLYLEMPGRKEENERFIREWRAQLEERWAKHPPLVRSVTYYMRRAPFEPRAALTLLIVVVALIVFVAFVSPHLGFLSPPR